MSLILSGTDGLSDVDGSAATPAIRGTDTNTGIFFPAADTIAFAEGGAEAMRIDSGGNLGLGVTPSAWSAIVPAFQVGGAFLAAQGTLAYSAQGTNAFYNGSNWIYRTSATASLYQQSAGVHSWQYASAGTAGNAITFTQAMTLDASGNLLVGRTSSPGNARIGVSGTSDTTTGINLSYSGVGEACIRVVSTNALTFGYDGSNGGTERARIDSAGRFLIGRTSSSFISTWGVMAVGQSAAIVGPPDSNAIFCANAYYDGSWKRVNAGVANILELTAGSSYIQFFTSASSTAGSSISFTSGPYIANGSNTWTNGSDARLKNITGEIQNGLAKVMTLRAAEFTWKHDADNKPCVGLIAQDVQAVLPEAVNETSYIRDDETKYLGVNYDQTIPLLVAAIKEQQALITQLQADVAALKGAA